jgi:hypothetical protein
MLVAHADGRVRLDLPGRRQPLGDLGIAVGAKLTGQFLDPADRAKHHVQRLGGAAGSSQSRSNAAFRLDAPSSGTPASRASTRVPSTSPHPAGAPTRLRP